MLAYGLWSSRSSCDDADLTSIDTVEQSGNFFPAMESKIGIRDDKLNSIEVSEKLRVLLDEMLSGNPQTGDFEYLGDCGTPNNLLYRSTNSGAEFNLNRFLEKSPRAQQSASNADEREEGWRSAQEGEGLLRRLGCRAIAKHTRGHEHTLPPGSETLRSERELRVTKQSVKRAEIGMCSMLIRGKEKHTGWYAHSWPPGSEKLRNQAKSDQAVGGKGRDRRE